MDSDEGLFDLADYESEVRQAAAALKIPKPKHALDEAREFGGWSLHKLDLLRVYLKLYRRVAGGGSYIDGFAGTGRILVDGKERPGSPRIAINSGAFRRLHFFELPDQAKQLERQLKLWVPFKNRRLCSIHPGDFNLVVLDLLNSEGIARDKPCFAFLDPYSTQLSWETVEALAGYKGGSGGVMKIELWVLLNTYQALVRLMPHEEPTGYATSPDATTLDRVMGGREAWWDLRTVDGRPEALANRYANRLQSKLGYGAARAHIILDPKTKRPQYHMIHASDHKAAFSFMRWAEVEMSQEPYEGPRLFAVPELSRRSR